MENARARPLPQSKNEGVSPEHVHTSHGMCSFLTLFSPFLMKAYETRKTFTVADDAEITP